MQRVDFGTSGAPKRTHLMVLGPDCAAGFGLGLEALPEFLNEASTDFAKPRFIASLERR